LTAFAEILVGWWTKYEEFSPFLSMTTANLGHFTLVNPFLRIPDHCPYYEKGMASLTNNSSMAAGQKTLAGNRRISKSSTA
jgi:hypothetical protein